MCACVCVFLSKSRQRERSVILLSKIAIITAEHRTGHPWLPCTAIPLCGFSSNQFALYQISTSLWPALHRLTGLWPHTESPLFELRGECQQSLMTWWIKTNGSENQAFNLLHKMSVRCFLYATHYIMSEIIICAMLSENLHLDTALH